MDGRNRWTFSKKDEKYWDKNYEGELTIIGAKNDAFAILPVEGQKKYW